MADLHLRDLTVDDSDAVLDVRHRSFGPMSSDARPWWDTQFARNVRGRRAIGVFADDVLIATSRLHEYHQLWGGRPVPMGGVAGVVVAPEWRGRGVSRLLMTATLRRGVDLGDALSVLFPAALPPYRTLGWELAGAVSRTSLSVDGLRRLGAPTVAVRRAGLADVEEVVALLARTDARTRASGPLSLTADGVRELIADSDNFCYLADDGFLVYAWDDKDLRVERLVAESAETTRSLWALAGSGASWVRSAYTYLPAHDPIHWFLADKATLDVQEDRWMLRVLDARKAVAERGFPTGVSIDVPLTLHDPVLPGCTGTFDLEVRDGSGGLCERDDAAGATRLGPNGLAALYAGTPLSTLRGAGLARGGNDHDDALLDSAFASRCYLIDSF